MAANIPIGVVFLGTLGLVFVGGAIRVGGATTAGGATAVGGVTAEMACFGASSVSITNPSDSESEPTKSSNSENKNLVPVIIDDKITRW